MGIQNQLIDCDRGLYRLVEGEMRGAEWTENTKSIERLNIDPKKLRYTITDMSFATKLNFTTDEISALANINIEYSKVFVGLKVALVAPRDISFGLSRMYEAVAESTKWDIQIFRSKTQALQWLRSFGFAPPENI